MSPSQKKLDPEAQTMRGTKRNSSHLSQDLNIALRKGSMIRIWRRTIKRRLLSKSKALKSHNWLKIHWPRAKHTGKSRREDRRVRGQRNKEIPKIVKGTRKERVVMHLRTPLRIVRDKEAVQKVVSLERCQKISFRGRPNPKQ